MGLIYVAAGMVPEDLPNASAGPDTNEQNDDLAMLPQSMNSEVLEVV